MLDINQSLMDIYDNIEL